MWDIQSNFEVSVWKVNRSVWRVVDAVNNLYTKHFCLQVQGRGEPRFAETEYGRPEGGSRTWLVAFAS